MKYVDRRFLVDVAEIDAGEENITASDRYGEEHNIPKQHFIENYIPVNNTEPLEKSKKIKATKEQKESFWAAYSSFTGLDDNEEIDIYIKGTHELSKNKAF